MNYPSLNDLLNAGMHFGHRTSRWHPKMESYIFGSRKGIHIIDLEKSRANLIKALEFISALTAENKKILLVGTKLQAAGLMKKIARETGMPYVTERWLGGTLTNFSVIKKSIKKFKELLEKKQTGQLVKYTKKERLEFDRELEKMERDFGGLVNLNTLPDAVFLWDLKQERTALAESQKKHLPIIAVCDTNVNPEGAAYVIPGNDDASKTIKLVLELVKEAILEGKLLVEKNQLAASSEKIKNQDS